MSNIFKNTAPAYYARGISVIPLRVHSKRPFLTGWQHYHERLVSENTQNEWLDNYANGNIGLVLGKQSNVAVIDIDTEDVEVIEIIEKLIPKSPWKRVGQKGYVAAYRFNGTPTFRINDRNGVRFVEHLSSRTQVVLPPSIHPVTGQPYISNCNLLDVIDDLPELSPDIEARLRSGFELEGRKLSSTGWTKITEYVSSGSRDTQMIRVAGLSARGVTRGEISFRRALNDVRGWHESRVEKVAGDDIDINKGLRRVAEYVRADVEKGIQLPVGWDEGLTEEDLKNYGLMFTEDDQQWTYDKIMEYISTEFSLNPENSRGRIEAVEKIIKKLSCKQSTNLNPMEESLILNKMKSGFEGGMSIVAMRKRIAELAAGPIDGTDHSQIAREVLKDIEREVALRYNEGQFWSWEGSHWQPYDEQKIRLLISQNYGALPLARKSSDHKGILEVMTQICSQGISEGRVEGVNFANGVFTEDGKLIPHQKEQGFTYTLPYRYLADSAHKCDRFLQFLQMSWGEDDDYEDKVKALQEAICATVFGWAPRYQRVFCLYGVPRSGKSQLLEIIERLVPEGAVASISFDKWHDGPSLVALDGKLVNIVGELSSHANIRSDIFNKVVVGEPVALRRLYKSTYTTNLKAAHWIGSNHAPRSKDYSAGFNRRWLYLVFGKQVAKDKIIPNLGREIILEERESILAWAMEARERLLKVHGYTLPESHKEMVGEVAGLNDSIRFFVLSSGKVQTLEKVAGKWTSNPISDIQLHDAYSNYCIMRGAAKPVSIRNFKLRIREIAQTLGWERKRGKNPMTGEVVSLYRGPTLVN